MLMTRTELATRLKLGTTGTYRFFPGKTGIRHTVRESDVVALLNRTRVGIRNETQFMPTLFTPEEIAKEHDWCQCTPDGLLTDLATGQRGNWECKTTNTTQNVNAWRDWDKQVPRGYFINALHQMYVLEVAFTIFTAYLYNESFSTMRHFRIDRDPHIEAQIREVVAKEAAFMDYVRNNKQPPLEMWL